MSCWQRIAFLLVTPSLGLETARKSVEPAPPDLLLEGGRKLQYERSFSSQKETQGKRGFWTKLVDVIIGEPDHPELVRPYSIAVDSRGRAIVTDPGANGIHIFDFENHKYKFIERRDKDRDPMRVTAVRGVDAQDNIYVTDSKSGKIFVFEPSGKFRRMIGSLKGGEGYFKTADGNCGGFGRATDLHHRYAAGQGFHPGYERQRAAEDRAHGAPGRPSSICRRNCWSAIRTCLWWMR